MGRPRLRSKPYRPSVGLPDSIVRAISRGSVLPGRAAEGPGGAEHLAVGLHRHQVEIAGEALHHAGEEHVAGARVGREYFLPLGQAHQQLLGGVDQALLLTGDGVGHDRGVALGVTQGQLAGLEVDDDHPGGERAEADHPDDDDAPPDS